MNILVTGYKGFIGSHVFKRLHELGHNVVGYDYNDVFPSVEGMDWVIHLGAISSTTFSDVRQILKQNVAYTENLWRDCVKHNVKFQFASSASVYGNQNKTFREDDPVNPTSPYSWSKAISESLIMNTLGEIPTYQIFRYFNVYGSNEDHKGDQSSPYHKFKQQAMNEGEIEVFENSENYLRDFVPVEFVVRVHEEFLNKDVSGIFNVGTGKAKSFLDVARSFNATIKNIPMPDKLKSSYQTYTEADVTKLKKLVDFV